MVETGTFDVTLAAIFAGREHMEVAGEPYRREAFAQLFAAAGRLLGGVIMRDAILVADPQNDYDPKAVTVHIDGTHDEAHRISTVVLGGIPHR